MKLPSIFFLTCASAVAACSPSGGFGFAMPVTFATTPANNYPIIFDTSKGADGATATANLLAGAESASGYDVQFFTSAGVSLKYGMWSYSSGVGRWTVKVPTPSTEVCAYYGNSSETSDGSDWTASTGVYSDFDCVLLDASLTDRSGNSCTPTFTSGSAVTAAGLLGTAWDMATHQLTFSGLSANTDTNVVLSMIVNNDNDVETTPLQRFWNWPTTGADLESFWYNADGSKSGHFLVTDAVAMSTTPLADLNAAEWNLITVSAIGTTSAETWLRGVSKESITPSAALSTRNGALTFGSNEAGSGGYFLGLVNYLAVALSGTSTTPHSSGAAAWQLYDWNVWNAQDATIAWGAEVAAATETAPPPVLWFWTIAQAGEWLSVAAETCTANEVQLGDACVADPGGNASQPGAMSIQTGGLYQ